jgi:hypothetical protein
MKGMIPVKGYRDQTPQHEDTDFRDVLKGISPLTKVGAGCFVAGKLFGILAIPAVFIPSLNILAIPLIVCWGSLIFTTIVVCSFDHFVINKKNAEASQSKAAEVQTWLAEHPDLREEILADLLQEQKEVTEEKKRIVNLSNYR